MILGCNTIVWIKFWQKFSGCLGSGCCALGTAMASAANQGLFATILDLNMKFDLGDVGVKQVVLSLGGLGGLEPPSSTSGKF